MAPKKRNFGNIRQLPSGRFQARYTGPDGSTIKAPATYTTRRQAEQWLATEHADLTRGTWRDPAAGSETLSDYLISWLETHPDIRPRTRELYTSLANRFIIQPALQPRSEWLGDRPIRQITATTVRHWHSWVQSESRRGSLAKQAPASEGSPRWNRALRAWAQREGLEVAATGRIPDAVRDHWERCGRPTLVHARNDLGRAGKPQTAQAYRLLHAVFETAVAEGRVHVNPCQLKGASTAKAPERDPATSAEVAAIAAASPHRYRVAVLIAAWGGLRAGEIFALERGSVDFLNGQVTVRQGLSYLTGQGFFYGEPKSHKGYRKVNLPASVMEAIAHHMEEFTGPERDALLFTTRTGRPVPSSRRTTWFRRAAETAGRDDLRFHDLRHTGATLAGRTGATMADLQSRLGHSTVRAAMVYQHTSAEADRQIAARLEAHAAAS